MNIFSFSSGNLFYNFLNFEFSIIKNVLTLASDNVIFKALFYFDILSWLEFYIRQIIWLPYGGEWIGGVGAPVRRLLLFFKPELMQLITWNNENSGQW